MIADPSVFATPSEATDLAPTRETATEGFEGLTDEALAADDAEDAWPAAGSTDTIDWSVPSEWGQGPIADESSDDEAASAGEGVDAAIIPLTSVPSGDDLDGATDDDPGDPSDVSAAPGDARLDEESPHGDEPDGAADLGPTAPGTEPAPIDEPAGIPDLEPTASLTYASAGAATNGHRRGTIDWTGPVHTVDEHVHTAGDILEASAATALPTDTDRPAPATGSELARLLAKVEARLRDYD